MANRIYIPTGAIPRDQLEDAILALTKTAGDLIYKNFTGWSLEIEKVVALYEESGKGGEVLPKCLENKIVLRRGLVEGACLRISWKRSDPDQVCLCVDSSSKIEDYLFSSTFVLAAVFALGSSPILISARTTSRIVILMFFFPAWLILQIPYFGFRVSQRRRNRQVIEHLLDTTRRCFGTEVDPGSK